MGYREGNGRAGSWCLSSGLTWVRLVRAGGGSFAVRKVEGEEKAEGSKVSVMLSSPHPLVPAELAQRPLIVLACGLSMLVMYAHKLEHPSSEEALLEQWLRQRDVAVGQHAISSAVLKQVRRAHTAGCHCHA